MTLLVNALLVVLFVANAVAVLVTATALRSNCQPRPFWAVLSLPFAAQATLLFRIGEGWSRLRRELAARWDTARRDRALKRHPPPPPGCIDADTLVRWASLGGLIGDPMVEEDGAPRAQYGRCWTFWPSRQAARRYMRMHNQAGAHWLSL